MTNTSLTRLLPTLFGIMAETHASLLPPTLTALNDLRPDILVCDGLSPFCLQAARQLNLKLVVLWASITAGIPDLPGAIHPSPMLGVMGSGMKPGGGLVSRLKMMLAFEIKQIAGWYGNSLIRRENRKLGYATLVDAFGADHLLEELVVSWTAPPFDAPRMMPPLLKLVGPLVNEHVPELDAKFTDFIGEHNIIVVSFGTTINLHTEYFTSLRNTLETIAKTQNLKIIWALSKTQSSFLPPTIDPFTIPSADPTIAYNTNHTVLYTRWAPQLSLLAHPNTTLFISHSGCNGVHESLYFSVPVLGIPTAADHHDVCARLESVKAGECVGLGDLRTGKFREVLVGMLAEEEEVYRRNVQRVARMFRDAGGVVEAAKWVEWRGRQEGLEAWSVSGYVREPWWRWYYLDVLMVECLVVGGLVWVGRQVWMVVRRSRSKAKEGQQRRVFDKKGKTGKAEADEAVPLTSEKEM
ncbi:hypothetical protein HDV00_008359 [Rhizophlyctis rosea]|nr:hypothetical protein HDV00_008359 [Rhizophlyctis rosea]